MWSKLLLYLRRFGLKIFELIERKPSLHKSSYERLNERLKKVTILESLNYKHIRKENFTSLQTDQLKCGNLNEFWNDLSQRIN